jgi:hypothetical protein
MIKMLLHVVNTTMNKVMLLGGLFFLFLWQSSIVAAVDSQQQQQQQACFLDRATLENSIAAAIADSTDGSGDGHLDPIHGLINNWCFGPSLTDFSNLFQGKNTFNANIRKWNVSRVTNMQGMVRYDYNVEMKKQCSRTTH